MRSTPLATLMLLAGGAASFGACLQPNPAFDAPGGLPATASTGADGMPTTDGVTSADPTTGATTGEASTGADTTGSDTTGGIEPGSTGMSSETGDTTGEPADCWDLPIDAFVLEPLQPQVIDAGSPSLSPDGLDLYFKAPVAPPILYEVRRLSRAAPEDDFVGPASIFFGPPDTTQLDYPEVAAGTTRIFFTQENGDIYMARQQDGVWGTWKVAGTTDVFKPQQRESHPNATEDGALLLYQREDGPTVGPFRTTFNFYQAPYDAQNDVFHIPPVQVTPNDPALVLPLCPAMSPDGLHLLFAAKDAEGELANVNDGSVGAWYTRRAAPDMPWDTPIRSAAVRETGWITCPASITADGCQATLVRFTHPGTLSTMHLARRG